MFNASQWLSAALPQTKAANLAPDAAARYEVRARQGRVMVFLRILGKALLFLAFLAAAYDGARNLATPGQGLLLTSLSTHLKAHFPGSMADVESFFLASAPAWVWNSIVAPLLWMPPSLVLAALGTTLFLAGYRKPPARLYSD
jgi:hypothetical protein